MGLCQPLLSWRELQASVSPWVGGRNLDRRRIKIVLSLEINGAKTFCRNPPAFVAVKIKTGIACGEARLRNDCLMREMNVCLID